MKNGTYNLKKDLWDVAVFEKLNTIKKYEQNFDISRLKNYNVGRKVGEKYDLYIRWR